MAHQSQLVIDFSNYTHFVEPIQATVSKSDLHADFAASAKTSIARKHPSAPLQILLDLGLLRGSVLNYGKGRWTVDSDAISASVGHCIDYDYTHCPSDVIQTKQGYFNSCFAGYVLNTLPPRSRDVVWTEIATMVRKGQDAGSAFIGVRSDKNMRGESFEDGIITSIGTFQTSYTRSKLLLEAQRHFEFVKFLPSKSGFLLIQCSHSAIDN
jgi:hypothetical protein